MSTEVQPSHTPAPQPTSPIAPPRSSSWHPSSIFPRNKRGKSPPPAALNTQGQKRHHRRSSSLGEALAKLKPSNRPERGGTLRIRNEDGEHPIENDDGAESNGNGRAFDMPGPATLANHSQHVQSGLVVSSSGEGNWKSSHPGHNFEHPALASPSKYASWSLDRSQRKWTDARLARERDSRSNATGSPERQLASDASRAVERRPGWESTSQGHAAAVDPGTHGGDHDAAYQRLATTAALSTRVSHGSPKPIGASAFRGTNRSAQYTDRPESGGRNRGTQGDGKETIHPTASETAQSGTEMDETSTNEKPGHGSGRGNGLRKLLGSWGKKTNPEKSSASPDIERMKKPVPALPPMAQDDLGFRVSVPNFSEDKQISTAQQMFEDKKARREQRRSLKESGDYLGVQGANPRTGYWDVSSGSEPSQMSEETKQKLDEEAREVAERKRRYEEAEKKHRIELDRVQTMRENKKKMEKKMKQRRRGKWQLSENGWSSVAEPELSPILQSVVGTPIADLSPADRLFPMPTAADPTPYVDPTAINEKDYFGHRPVSSPLRHEYRSTEAGSTHSIPRKPVGSPSRRQNNESSITTIHNPAISSPARLTPGTPNGGEQNAIQAGLGISIAGNTSPLPKLDFPPSTRSPSQRLESFLEKAAQMEVSEDPCEKRASVISYQSVSTKQVQIHRPSVQNQRNPSRQARIITCLNELPPVILKDPFAAGLPSNSPMKETYQVWMPPTIIRTEPDPISSTNMSTTTTTGNDLRQSHPAQLDGQDTNEGRARVPLLQHKLSRIPLRKDAFHDGQQRQQQSISCQTQPADTVTSSVHQLGQMKERTARLCQMPSPEGEKVEMKSTPISISTSLSPEEDKQAARNAAQMAFQHLRHTLAVKKAEKRNGDQLIPPKLRKQKVEIRREANRVVPDGRGGIGSPLKTKQTIKVEPSPIRKKPGSEDKLMVRHPHPSSAPKAENAGRMKGRDRKAVVLHQAGMSPVNRALRQAQAQLSVGQVVLGLLQNAWLFVEPVFNPDSGIRKRFDKQSLTWQDIGLFFAAALFCGGMFIVLVILARVVGIGLQALRSFGVVFRLLIGV
ncbi:hypothetical protein ONS95_012558 [Cadophora gregata]|uniref:uncharacterized protein n=1 Tax=Cadophora gregata TaxID=51156 RepID=UPI0026DC961A|nr:uncharacterized protein ONS95_012558 [Cadophora gregata]KAK0118257.1 hypothetical protein ONS95_012558 [Cadophora gregata]KAK0123330.1 hypothetical protein ONS96_010324 [Cadophora gregata f. sp. sojae]